MPSGSIGPLRLGVAGPVSLDLLDYPQGLPAQLPPGYPAPIVSHFVNALLKREHNLVVFTTSQGLAAPVVIDQGRLVVCVAPRYRPRSALSFFARERRWLRSLMLQYSCDLVHAMWSYEFALAALQAGIPTVVHYHDHARTILKHTPDPYRFLRWLLSEYVTTRADHRIANSVYLKEAFGRRGRKMRVIHNFLPACANHAGLGPVTRTHAMVTVSNGFHGHKNIAVALEAFARLRRQGRLTDYRLIGAGMDVGEEAQTFARREGLDEGVSFLGSLPFDQTLTEIRSAALLLHPALEESFGMTILEAMAEGTPVVAGRASGNVPYLLEAGRCGYLCDVRDPRDISDTIAAALSQTAETEARVARARRRAQHVYAEDAVMERLEEYYEQVPRRSRSTRGHRVPRSG